MKTRKKRKDECFTCTSRACYTRVVRENDPKYDEVACRKHIKELEHHADEMLGSGNGIIRSHISSTGYQKRGVALTQEMRKEIKGEEQITVPILIKHDNTKVVGCVTIDKNMLTELHNSYLGPGFIANGNGTVKELLDFGLSPIDSFPVVNL